jgi:hypothetical protein
MMLQQPSVFCGEAFFAAPFLAVAPVFGVAFAFFAFFAFAMDAPVCPHAIKPAKDRNAHRSRAQSHSLQPSKKMSAVASKQLKVGAVASATTCRTETSLEQNVGPDQQRTTPLSRRIAQRPGNAELMSGAADDMR